MFGQYTETHTGDVFSAFCEDDFLYTITRERDGVELDRVVVSESQAEALLRLFENDDAQAKA